MRSYIGYIVSGINDKWQIVHHTLDFKLLKKRHTGDTIKEAYDQLCFDNRNFFFILIELVFKNIVYLKFNIQKKLRIRCLKL